MCASAQLGLAALYAVRDEMYRRNALLGSLQWVDENGHKRKGLSFFDPNHPVIRQLELPLIVLTIEEAPTFLGQAGVKAIVEELARMARKCGIKLRLVVQVPLLDQLGGSSTIRDQVAAGNVIVLRTANRLSGPVAFNGALPVDPATLPREWPDGTSTAGLAYVLGPRARPASCRIDYVADPHLWAEQGELTELPEVVAAYERYVEAARKARAKAATGSVETGPDATVTDRIVEYLGGVTQATTGTIASALEVPLSTVSSACARAAEAGRVRNVRRGVWALPDSVEAVEPAIELEPVA